jgi:hypothetical protein
MKESSLGKVLFNLQRFQILQTKLNPQTTDLISDSYAYAWEAKMYPSLDGSGTHLDLKDLDLKEYFSITEEQFDLVGNRADSEWLQKRYYSFYQYEEFFGVNRPSATNGLSRVALICIFRYSFLRRGFDQPFWDKLLEPMEHPTEASIITAPFELEDLFLV